MWLPPPPKYFKDLSIRYTIFLAFPLPLFLGALLSDAAYASSYEVQCINFAEWLIAGGLLVGASRRHDARDL